MFLDTAQDNAAYNRRNNNFFTGINDMEFWTIKKVAEEKSVSVSTLRQFLKMGLPHFKPKRKIYIDPDEYDDWFSKFRNTTKSSSSTDFDKIIDDALSSVN